MHLAGFEALAIGLYTLPLFTFLAARSTRETSLVSLGLDVPFFVALDLLGIILLACVVPLEVAVLLSRPAWVAGCAGFALGSRRLGRAAAAPPRALRPWTVVATLASAALAVAVSASLSRHYLIWDRYWHGPQVTALAMQKVPFVNVVEYTAKLQYHYAGDVAATVFRALSFNTLSADRALSIAHDVAFGLTAAALALQMLGRGLRRGWLATLGGASILLVGPIPFRPGVSDPLFGFMHLNFLTVSFRPHVPLAALLMVGFVGAVASNPLARPGEPREPVGLRLITIAGLLSLTDETSLAVLDVGLGFAWLFDSRVLGAGRARGVVLLAAIAALSVLPSRFLGGSLSAGGPVQKLAWAAAQVPSSDHVHPNLLFPGEPARKALESDLLPFLMGGVGLVLGTAARPSRPVLALLVFATTVTGVCFLCAMHIQVNGESAVESQRFFLAPFFAVFVIALLLLPRVPLGGPASVAIVGTIALQAFFSLYWVVSAAPDRLAAQKVGADPTLKDLYDIDCREGAGATMGEKARPTYIERDAYCLYATCRPAFSPGDIDPPWPTKIFPQTDPARQLALIDRDVLSKGVDATAVCLAGGAPSVDPVCRLLLTAPSSCRPAGRRFVRCPLTRQVRATLPGHL